MKKYIKLKPLLCACIASVVSAIICSFLNPTGILIYCASLLFALTFVIPIKTVIKKEITLIFVLSLIISISAYIYNSCVYQPVLKYNGREMTINCKAISEPIETESGYSIDVKCIGVLNQDKTEKANFKTRIYYSSRYDIYPSSEFSVDVVFFEKEQNDRFDGSGIHIGAYATDIVVARSVDSGSIIYNYYKLRNNFKNAVAGNSESSGFIKAMIFGDKQEIRGSVYNTFRTIGMSHILAVSGMHLMFAVMFFDFFLLLFGVGYKTRAYVSLVAIVLFTVISGFSVSCIRAAIMLFILYIGRITGKLDDGFTSLSVAAFIILLLFPYDIRNASFILSASAVFGIIVITPILNKRINIKTENLLLRKILYWLRGMLTMSLGANIACLPVFVFMFKEVSLISPITNIVLTLPIQALFYLGFLLIVFGKAPFISDTLSIISEYIYNIIIKTADFFYGIKYITISDGNRYFYLVFILFFVLIFGIVVYTLKFEKLRIYPYVLSYGLLCVILCLSNLIVNSNYVKVDFIDVGQGDCTMISNGGKAIFIDCGGSETDGFYDALRRASINKIDLIAITHADRDHTKFLNYLIKNYKVDKIVYPEFCEKDKLADEFENARKNGIELCEISNDCKIEVLNSHLLTVLVEKAYETNIDSNTSAVYKLNCHNTSIIFPGDSDVYQEYVYQQYGDLLDCDMHLVAHHGSKMSSLVKTIEMYSADYAVISVGDNNFGLPDDRVINLVSKNSKLLRTDENSTITFKINNNGYRLVN